MRAAPAEKRVRRYSILKHLTFSLAAVYVLLFSLMLVNDLYAVQAARREICMSLLESLKIYNDQIASNLSNAETYLAGKASQSSAAKLRVLEQEKKDSKFYVTLTQEKTDMDDALYTLDLLRGLFLYPTTNQTFVSSSKDASEAAALRDITRKAQEADVLSSLPARRWFPVFANGKYHLVRYFRQGDTYVGAWTDFSSLLAQVETRQELVEHALFSFQPNNIYDSSSQKSYLRPSVGDTEDGYTLLKADKEYLAISVPAEYTSGGHLVMLVPDESLSSRLMQNYFLMMVIGAVFLLSFIVVFYILRRYVKRPIGQLKDSIDALHDGDFSTRVAADYECVEFAQVNTAFNDMVERIQDLKISVYEEQLHQKEAEMKFLKSQVAPHFLINCLNAMYHLAGADETQLIQKMAVSLGSHLRYTLAERPIVPLQQELDMAQNYIEISKLRFPGCIESFLTVDERVRDAECLPMILLNFVENTVKFSVVMGELVEIHIEAVLLEEGPSILVRVWDTGSGWPQEMLDQLNRGEFPSQEEGYHIGMRNAVQRGSLIYGDAASVRFSNHPGAGAQIEMKFPYRKYREIQETEDGQES